MHYILGNEGWAPFPDFTQPRQGFSLTVLNEKIVMIGGQNAERSIEYINIQNGYQHQAINDQASSPCSQSTLWCGNR